MDDVSSCGSDTGSVSSLQVSVPDSHRPRWSYLPDLRLEQFFLATVRHMVTVTGSSMDAKDPDDPRVYPEVSETAPVEGRTRWKDVQSVAWYAPLPFRTVLTPQGPAAVCAAAGTGLVAAVAGRSVGHWRRYACIHTERSCDRPCGPDPLANRSGRRAHSGGGGVAAGPRAYFRLDCASWADAPVYLERLCAPCTFSMTLHGYLA